jgi:hypothetical protein
MIDDIARKVEQEAARRREHPREVLEDLREEVDMSELSQARYWVASVLTGSWAYAQATHQDDALRAGDEDRAQRLNNRAKLGHRVAEKLRDHDPLTSHEAGFLKEALENYILHTEEDWRLAGLEDVDMSIRDVVRGLADPEGGDE